MLFSDVLLTVDFDRTLTAQNSTIPERNLEAIAYFMENGGAFTVNTGRSIPTFRQYLYTLPHSTPFLLYNGGATWQDGKLDNIREIPVPLEQVVSEVSGKYPDLNLEVQGVAAHFCNRITPGVKAFYDFMKCDYAPLSQRDPAEPFLKFSLFGYLDEHASVDSLFHATAEEVAEMDAVEQWLKDTYAGRVAVFRAAPRIVDVQANGVSKIRSARNLQAQMGRKILVCVGDAENDRPMLEGADFAYVPADGVIAGAFDRVCGCDDGAVADVIYKKIPEILKNS